MQSAAKNGGKNGSRSYTPGRIHVSQLPKNITDDDMLVHFSRFGTLVEAHVAHTNYRYNFGFITFADPDVVDRLIGENSSVTQFINGTRVIINRACADNPGRGIQANRRGGSGSRGGGEGSAANGSSRGVRPEISHGNYVVPELLPVLNNGGENCQGSSQCSGGVSTTAGSRIQRPPGFMFQEHADVWGQPPAPTSSTPLPRPRPQTPPSLPVPPPLALSEGSLLPSSTPQPPLPLSTSQPALTSSPPATSSTVMPLPPPTSSTPLPALPSSTPPPPATSSTVMPLSLSPSEWPELKKSVDKRKWKSGQ